MTVRQKLMVHLLTALVLSVLSFGPAQASERATTKSDVNLRAGPGTDYDVISTVKAGTTVRVNSCNSGYSWCDVSVSEYQGYISGQYLFYEENGEYYDQPFSNVGMYLGLSLFWRDYPIYYPPHRPPGHKPPGHKPPGHKPPGHKPPGHKPPGHKPPDGKPPHTKPPSMRPPGHRPPHTRPPGHRPPSARPGGGRPGGRPAMGGRRR